MKIDYVVAVLYDPSNPKAQPPQRSAAAFFGLVAPALQQEAQWSPAPTTDTRTANFACAWADPFWSGITCSALPSKSQTLTRVFRICGDLQPLPLPTVAPPPVSAVKTICNSLKIHFFREGADDNEHASAPPDERKLDFLYASAFPLFRSSSDDARSGSFFGLFNYNGDDASSDPLPGLCLAVTPCGPPARVPNDALVLCVSAASAQSHTRACALANFVIDAFQRFSPHIRSNFCNMRTFGRDPYCTPFFQDLAQLFDTPWTYLPFTLAVYALWGALQVNGFASAARFASALSYMPVPQLLRILRDAFACFTLCVIEGLYWADMSLRAPVEDQPFPLTFMPATRVFAKDDCEGRATQIQQMKLLFICAERRRIQIGLPALLQEIRAMRSARLIMGLGEREVETLVGCCCRIGALLEARTVDVHTVVGDVHFGSLQVRLLLLFVEEGPARGGAGAGVKYLSRFGFSAASSASSLSGVIRCLCHRCSRGSRCCRRRS